MCVVAVREVRWCRRSDQVEADAGRVVFFFFNDPATTEISPLSLHDALPISPPRPPLPRPFRSTDRFSLTRSKRSEEHTSELQSPYVLSDALLCFNNKPA